MTEDQLREIPYTVVETNSRRSVTNIRIHKASGKAVQNTAKAGNANGAVVAHTPNNHPNTPHSAANGSAGSGNASNGILNGQAKDRVDRIRG